MNAPSLEADILRAIRIIEEMLAGLITPATCADYLEELAAMQSRAKQRVAVSCEPVGGHDDQP
jgi:hypothetical protein